MVKILKASSCVGFDLPDPRVSPESSGDSMDKTKFVTFTTSAFPRFNEAVGRSEGEAFPGGQ